MQVLDQNGLFLPALDLWLDPHHARPVAFVSHAHADHMKRHKRVFSTRATAAMMQARGATKTLFHSLDWRQNVEWKDALVSLYPAGHVLGSSQILVEDHAGTRLLYSGDFKLRPGRSCEPIEIPRADILVMETTFGRPNYGFPDNETVLADLRAWCATTLRNGDLPVVFCYSLGKGQEVLAGLREGDFPIFLHEKHHQISAVYTEHGADFPAHSLHEIGREIEGVLLCASQCKRSKWWNDLTANRRVKTAYVSGWALNSSPARFGTDAAFALSDHADYEDLLEYVRLSGAQKIWTTHGYAQEFAADLRSLGFEAAPVETTKKGQTGVQLSLF